jgi:hypothetical protein
VKAPKEVETHYLRGERIPEVPPNPYRPGTGLGETGRVHEIGRGYLANKHQERTENPTREYEVESSPLGTETDFDSVISRLMSGMDEMKLEPTVESAEATLENPTDSEIDAALRAPELYESYEFPMKDIELLLTELDAIPFETKIEAEQELGKVENAERSL